jgi:hypothetical protein
MYIYILYTFLVNREALKKNNKNLKDPYFLLRPIGFEPMLEI